MARSRASKIGLIWFVKRKDKIRGPMGSARVRQLIENGVLLLTDEVSHDKQHWQAAGQVAEVLPMPLRQTSVGVEDALATKKRRRSVHSAAATLITGAVLILLFFWVQLNHSEPRHWVADCKAPARPRVVWADCVMPNQRWPGADISQSILSAAYLANSHFAAADFRAANLSYAQLMQSDLSYADFTGASLVGANLQGVDLTNAVLRDVDLSHANLTGATLRGADLQSVRLRFAIWVDGSVCGQNNCRLQ